MTVELTALAQYIASGLVVGAIYGLIGVAFFAGPGTIALRSLALGASTP